VALATFFCPDRKDCFMPPQVMIQRGSLLLLFLFVSGCLSPSPEELSQKAEDTVLELYRTENYELLSDRDKQAGTAEQFAKLSPFGDAQVRSTQGHKYYDLEAFLIEQTEYHILTSSYDPETESTAVTAEWVAPELYYELLINDDGVFETETAERALSRFEAGTLTEGTVKLSRFELDPVTVDGSGVFIDLENKLAVQRVLDRVEPDRQLIHDIRLPDPDLRLRARTAGRRYPCSGYQPWAGPRGNCSTGSQQ
jgi:hypothetical protein